MNLRRKLLSLLTSVACLISCMCLFGETIGNVNKAEAAEITGKSAFDITSQMTIGWNLGNTLDSWNASYTINTPPRKFATAWGNPEPTEELFKTIKNGGFNTVRIPVTWFQHLAYNESTSTYEIDDAWMAYVKQTVDYAYNLGLYVILNVHHEDWVNVSEFNDTTLADASLKIKGIWSRVSDEFKDYDQHLIFEGMNEPRQTGLGSSVEWGSGDTYSRAYINTLNSLFIDSVRSQGSASNNERLLMLPGYCASSDSTAVNGIDVPANSGNVALSVHAYAPYSFTMDTSSTSNHSFPGKDGWGNDYESALRNLFNSLKSISDSKGVPIIIGEFGASDFNNTTDRQAWANCYLSNAKNAGIPCVLWDNNEAYNGTGEAHGYLYRLTNTWYPNSLNVVKSMMDTLGVTGYQLPEYSPYQPPVFSWDNINIGADWKQMYYSKDGTNLAAWKNFTVSGWKDIVSEDYKYALIYDSTTEPYLVYQGGWYRINCNDALTEDFILYFTYEDMVNTLKDNGVIIDDMDNLFISAASSSATIYGLYAIPVNSADPEIKGDLNGDGETTVSDVVLLQKYIVKAETLTEEQLSLADLNDDGSIDCFDAMLLRRKILSVQ